MEEKTTTSTVRYASVGLRFLALLIDGIILGIVLWVFFAAFGDKRLGDCESAASIGMTTYYSDGEYFSGLCGASTYGYILVYAAYFIGLEWLIGGTLGKLALRLRVHKIDNTKMDFVSALVRNLLRVIDFLPFAYLLGAILIWTSPKRQRLGDRLAKTVVVRK